MAFNAEAFWRVTVSDKGQYAPFPTRQCALEQDAIGWVASEGHCVDVL